MGVGGLVIRVSPYFSEFYIQKLNQILTENIREKLPVPTAGGREKDQFWNMQEYSVLLNKTKLKEKLFYQSLKLLSFFRA